MIVAFTARCGLGLRESIIMEECLRYAGLVSRLLAVVVDFVLFSAAFFPITRLVKGVWLMTISDHRWTSGWVAFDPICLAFLVVIIAYYVLLEAYAGATVGKWVVGIRVVDLDGKKPGLVTSLLRNVLRLIDSLPALNILGVILILQSKQNARLGDRVAGTRVVRA